jgi:hypothetical protein
MVLIFRQTKIVYLIQMLKTTSKMKSTTILTVRFQHILPLPEQGSLLPRVVLLVGNAPPARSDAGLGLLLQQHQRQYRQVQPQQLRPLQQSQQHPQMHQLQPFWPLAHQLSSLALNRAECVSCHRRHAVPRHLVVFH